jgi:hypothetical protein
MSKLLEITLWKSEWTLSKVLKTYITKDPQTPLSSDWENVFQVQHKEPTKQTFVKSNLWTRKEML